MPIARNEAGDIVVLGQDGQWTPAQRAVNPETKETLIHDGSAWVPEPGPERSAGERIARGIVMPAAGFNESVATTAGALPDLVGAGMRAVGLPSSSPGQYTDFARKGLRYITGEPPKPETTIEKGLYGVGRGIGDAASVLIPSTAIAQGARAGGLTSELAQALAAQPVTQLAAGGVGGATADMTGSPAAGMAAAMMTPLAMQGASRLAMPIRPNQPPEMQRLIQVAKDEGLQMTPGQETGSTPLRKMEQMFSQMPFTSGAQQEIQQQAREAFNRASLAKSGTISDVATPDVLNAARSRIGGQIGEIADRNVLQVTPEVRTTLGNMAHDADQFMEQGVAQPFINRINQVLEHPGGEQIPGSFYRQLDSALGRSINGTSNGDLRTALGNLRETLRTAMDASISPADQEAWQEARRQYANLMVSAKAASGAGEGSAMGNISPLALRGAIDQSTGRGYGFGRGDQNDLARIGQSVLRPPADSGTPSGSLMQSPLHAALMGAVARPIQSIYNTDAARTYLTEGIPGLSGLAQQSPEINRSLVAALMAPHAKDLLPGPRQ